jgi:hypothetical protein
MNFSSPVTGGLLVAVVALFNPVRAQELSPETKNTAESENAPAPKFQAGPSAGQVYLSRKLDTMIIPGISFTYASLEEALSRIHLFSAELDVKEPDPAKKGVSFVILKPRAVEGQPPPKPARVNFNQSDDPLRGILDEIAAQSDTRYTIGDTSITFVPAGGKDVADLTRAEAEAADKAATRIGPKTVENLNKLRKLVIPIVNFEDTTVVEAVDFLNARARELSKGAPPIKIGPRMDPDTRIEHLRLRNIPLLEALTYCTEAVGDEFHIHDDGVQIGK